MQRLGRYEILEEIGRGAMGTVYRARDPKIDRVVAIKTISVEGMTPSDEVLYRQRFFREAQAAGQLSHSSIVTIYDVGEDDATHVPFIVMECISGQTLEALASGERLPLATSLALTHQLAEALHYAHSRQIVHRDIKPANILVTPEGQAKITDFGIAKLQRTQFTQSGYVLGTPAYMSPEQLTGGAVDGRSDVFALGVILYWLLTGDKPFTGDTSTAISFKIVYKEPVPPSLINPSVDTDCDHVIARALAKNPEHRYQNGRESYESHSHPHVCHLQLTSMRAITPQCIVLSPGWCNPPARRSLLAEGASGQSNRVLRSIVTLGRATGCTMPPVSCDSA